MKLRAVFQVLSLDLVSKVLVGISGILLIRYMPEAEYARYTLGISFAILVIGSLWAAFNRIYIIGADRLQVADEFHFLGFQFITLGVVALLFLPLRPYMDGLYAILLLVSAAACVSEFSKSLAQREMNFGRFSAIEIARSLVQVGGVLVLLFLMPGQPRAWQVFLVQALALGVVAAVALRRKPVLPGVLQVGSALRLGRRMIARGYMPLFGCVCVATLLSQIDVFMLKGLSNDHQVATYGSAFRYYNLLSLALAAVHVVLLPTIQQARSPDEEDAAMSQQLRLAVAFTVPVVLSAWAAQWLIPLVDAGRYPGAVAVYQVLALSAVASFALGPHVNFLFKLEDFNFLFGLNAAAAGARVVLDMMTIPRWGALGAAIVTLVVYGCVNGLIFWRATRLRTFRRAEHLATRRVPAVTASPGLR